MCYLRDKAAAPPVPKKWTGGAKKPIFAPSDTKNGTGGAVNSDKQYICGENKKDCYTARELTKDYSI